jgi:hypothetical protein
MCVCEQGYIYVQVRQLIALPHYAIRIKCYEFDRPMNSSGHFAS